MPPGVLMGHYARCPPATQQHSPYSPPTRNLTPALKVTGSAGYPTTSLYFRSNAFSTLAYKVTRGRTAYQPPRSARTYPAACSIPNPRKSESAREPTELPPRFAPDRDP